MKISNNHPEAFVSKKVETHQATISMTPEVFDIMISGIYSDKMSAPIRELICNARDSHVEAGVSLPIQIHAPTALEPWFSVKDQGLGMSKEMVTKTYMCFGTSTKRESNDLIGAKGIGSKSPFALIDAFQVSSVYNGTKSSYSVYKDKGLPNIAVVHSQETDERNGVEVKFSISPKLIDDFREKISRFLRYFDFPVEVNLDKMNKPDIAFTGMYEDFRVDILVNRLESRLVMGGVPYKSSWLDRRYEDSVIVTIPIGSCDIDPGREWTVENHTTTEFNNKLKNAVKEVTNQYFEKVKKETDALKTLSDCRDWYKGLSGRAKDMANDVLYKRFKLDKDVMFCYTQHASKGDRIPPRISNILEGTVIFMVKDKQDKIVLRAKQLLREHNAIQCFSLAADSNMVNEPFLEGVVFKASNVLFQKDKAVRTGSVERLKGHKVFVLSQTGIVSEQFSKKDIEEMRGWLVRDFTIKSYLGHVTHVRVGDFDLLDMCGNYKELLENTGYDKIYLLTEHQSKWADLDKKFKITLTSEQLKQIERSLVNRRAYNSHATVINQLREMQGMPGRISLLERVSTPKWIPSLYLEKIKEDKGYKQKAEEKVDNISKTAEKMLEEVRKNYPLLAQIPCVDYTSSSVKEYVKGVRLLKGDK